MKFYLLRNVFMLARTFFRGTKNTFVNA